MAWATTPTIATGAFILVLATSTIFTSPWLAFAESGPGENNLSRSWKTKSNVNTLPTLEPVVAQPSTEQSKSANGGVPVTAEGQPNERKLKAKSAAPATIIAVTPPPGRYVEVSPPDTALNTIVTQRDANGLTPRESGSTNSIPYEKGDPTWQGRYVDAKPTKSTDLTISAINVVLAEPQNLFSKRIHKDDLAALRLFYEQRADGPLWLKDDGKTLRADAIVSEISKADDWGLSSKSFELPKSIGSSDENRAQAEIHISASVLKYVRQARGGRVYPRSLTRLLDQKPDLLDPQDVLRQIENTAEPDRYLRSQHPKYSQFANLRVALLKARGTGEQVGIKPKLAAEEPKKPLVKISDDAPTLRTGMHHKAVTKLRERLDVPAPPGIEPNFFDETVEQAILKFQSENGMTRDGVVGPRTREVLNGGKVRKSRANSSTSKKSRIQKIILNMERWRWMPRDPGDFYVFNNIPEFRTRVFDNGKQIYGERIIVGKVKNPTPSFSADMQLVVFHPSWSVPNGIKQTEILPYLKQKTGFFGLGGADTRILAQHNLRVSQNGRPVDASKINWSQVDIRQFQFTQPPSNTNVLGKVKFRFPNHHDVYMHDTPERHLFSQSRRAESHGCIRVRNPLRFAEILLKHDKGWSAEKVGRLWKGYGSGTVKLDGTIPVHTAYFTAWSDKDGSVKTFGDLYGHDGRTARALGKRPIYDSADTIAQNSQSTTRPNPRPKKKEASSGDTVADILMNAFSP